ncbi:uncharacterized protein LOC121262678 isoform X1 [Juglans microcarpa x Juglans regia]|uniref:uncharacterized protein LOC121262678 isoform X1 n=2 Tax=Juglans microcarpa x Juglans regia TaxID=2249226 RepID=UPI001B7DA77B|nr:uncharacterized protein LOC121262678 isoform X1 [Juglans microcarpa x Juglans regia]
MIEASRVELLLFLIIIAFLSYAITPSYGESSTCLTVYKEGGAPAVFRSPKCPRWNLSKPPLDSRTTTARCQSATLQGRRNSQEDRTLCALDIRIPFPGKIGVKEVVVGIVAVFDGHNGADASDMASKLLLEYFVLHTYFLLDATFSKKSAGRFLDKREYDVFRVLNWDERTTRFKYSWHADLDDSLHLEILKEALLRAIHDIDVTFSKEASRRHLDSGSTATVILIADGQILVANIGDSKAFLCSEKFQSPAEAKATLIRLYREKRRNGAISRATDYDNFKAASSNGLVHFYVKELTRDHHPDRDDERMRVETAGGYVLELGGVPRVNGQLAISRAIGDVSFKSFGVISAPEVTDWQPLTLNDSYLVAASDGIFEKLSMLDVCDLLWEVQSHGTSRSELSASCLYSLADCLVNTAFEKGSMDNLAAVVVRLGLFGFSEDLLNERCVGEGDRDVTATGVLKFSYKRSAEGTTSDLVELDHTHPIVAKFERLLVKRKNCNFGYFHLFENLDEHMDYPLQAGKDDQTDYMYDLPQALPEALDQQCGGPLDLHNDQSLCFYLGMTVDGAKDQCINPEGFASFLGLLQSIPLHDTGSNYGSFEYAMPDLRYKLKKRFGRGSYGEVWLAFHWDCCQENNGSNCYGKNNYISPNSFHFNSNHSSSTHSQADPADENLFILKRVMVERGAAVYLSGLREKHFGEVFLNASKCLGGLLSAGTSNTVVDESQLGISDPLETNDTMVHENTWSFENVFLNKFRTQRVAYEEGLNHIARYVESFESRSNEIWLVFRHEGVSLSKLMYTVEDVDNNADEGVEHVKHVQILRPSKWWHWLKTTEAGQQEMRSLIWQLLLGIKSCHDRNITHRDIKPENMIICFEDQDTGRCLKESPTGDKNVTTKMRIIDFGSAIDDFTMKHFYGSTGPSRAEQTYEYAPPEALLNASFYHGPISTTLKYDMWSIGVVMLELILGSPNVFQISALTRALLDQHLKGWNEGLKELAYKLRSFMELCILISGSSSKHQHSMDPVGLSPASWKCSEEFFSNQIKSRDPLKLGFPNVSALRLVRHLLIWDPEDRFSVDEALRHPYFQPPPER